MTWKHLFFGFDGRISRRQWWLAMLPLLVASLVVSFLANPMSWYSELIAQRGPNLGETLFNLALLIPETAVTVKRFNDRDRPQWLPYGYAAVFLLYILLDHNRLILAGNIPTVIELGFVSSVAAIMLVIVIDNGFLRGTVGPNRYGPDPLAKDVDGTVDNMSGHRSR
ncbi:MAG: DUF805 domain-containing protein [Hyphomicrobiaceae bacterium]